MAKVRRLYGEEIKEAAGMRGVDEDAHLVAGWSGRLFSIVISVPTSTDSWRGDENMLNTMFIHVGMTGLRGGTLNNVNAYWTEELGLLMNSAVKWLENNAISKRDDENGRVWEISRKMLMVQRDGSEKGETEEPVSYEGLDNFGTF